MSSFQAKASASFLWVPQTASTMGQLGHGGNEGWVMILVRGSTSREVGSVWMDTVGAQLWIFFSVPQKRGVERVTGKGWQLSCNSWSAHFDLSLRQEAKPPTNRLNLKKGRSTKPAILNSAYWLCILVHIEEQSKSYFLVVTLFKGIWFLKNIPCHPD